MGTRQWQATTNRGKSNPANGIKLESGERALTCKNNPISIYLCPCRKLGQSRLIRTCGRQRTKLQALGRLIKATRDHYLRLKESMTCSNVPLNMRV